MDFGLRDGEYLVRSNKFGEYHRLYLWRAGVFQPLTPETRGDVDNLNIDREQGRVYYTLSQDGYGKALALDGRRGYRALKLLAFPARPRSMWSTSAAMAATSTSAWKPTPRRPAAMSGTARAASSANGCCRPRRSWTPAASPRPAWKAIRRATARRFRCSCAGRRAARPRPARWWSTSTAGRKGRAAPASPQAQLFVDAGFIYVQPNVRGSIGYGKTWLDSDNGPRRLQVLSDIEDAARYIRSHWGAAGAAPRSG